MDACESGCTGEAQTQHNAPLVSGTLVRITADSSVLPIYPELDAGHHGGFISDVAERLCVLKPG